VIRRLPPRLGRRRNAIAALVYPGSANERNSSRVRTAAGDLAAVAATDALCVHASIQPARARRVALEVLQRDLESRRLGSNVRASSQTGNAHTHATSQLSGGPNPAVSSDSRWAEWRRWLRERHGTWRMPVEFGIWRVEADAAVPVASSALANEAPLEAIIERDPSILGLGTLSSLVVRSSLDMGRGFDLLALDAEGTLSVKKGRTPREVVAQALDTATWISELTLDDLAELYARDHEGRRLKRHPATRAREVEVPPCIHAVRTGRGQPRIRGDKPLASNPPGSASTLSLPIVTPSQRSANGLQEPDSVAVLLGQAPIRLRRYKA
jgi:hypothetical protein